MIDMEKASETEESIALVKEKEILAYISEGSHYKGFDQGFLSDILVNNLSLKNS